MEPLQGAFTFREADLEILIYTVLAVFLGGAVGFERESVGKAAGVRTHALVSGAACLLVSLGFVLTTEFKDALPAGILRADPLGVIEAVVTGVSFLGAGTIIRGRSHQIEGLTTAATILFTAALGMTVASGRALLAVALTVMLVAALRFPSRSGKAARQPESSGRD